MINCKMRLLILVVAVYRTVFRHLRHQDLFDRHAFPSAVEESVPGLYPEQYSEDYPDEQANK